MLTDIKKRIASLTSNILNPFLVSLVTVVLISLKVTPTVFDAIKWSLILVAVIVLPVFLFNVYLLRSQKLERLFTSIRQQRTQIYLSAVICGAVGTVILFYFQAPLMLLAGTAAGPARRS